MGKKLKVFRLSLKEWLRGNSRNSELAGNRSELHHRGTDTFCCLGMYAVQCGIPRGELTGRSYPASLVSSYVRELPEDYAPLVSRRSNSGNSGLAEKAMRINDSDRTTDTQKIKALRPIFRKLGYRIEVVP